MLRHSLNRLGLENDTVFVEYDNVSLTDYIDIYGDNMCVTVTCRNEVDVRPGVTIHATKTHVLENSDYGIMMPESEIASYTVHSVDTIANSFTLIVPKYKSIECTDISIEEDSELGLCLYLTFAANHLFPIGDNEEPVEESDVEAQNNVLYVYYNESDYVRLTGFDVIDSYSVRWVIDWEKENFQELCEVVFPNMDYGAVSVPQYGNAESVKVRRIQTMWTYSDSAYDYNPYLSFEYPKVSVQVPISMTHDVALNSNEERNESFVNEGVRNSINNVMEMEKHVYRPAFVASLSDSGDFGFGFVRKINFNMHFRKHSGDNWITENGDTWNFIAYGSGSNANGYYSYDPNNKSNQSDLLCYAGFSDNDVKYQKNKLKKSFLRLSFYDSDNVGSQNLLSYATVFINSGELYSRYMSASDADIYKNINGDILRGVRVDREVEESLLASKLNISGYPDDDTIEEYRLSSRMTVSDPMVSSNSSEGFQVYLWADNDNGILPSDIYMKAEFNHAGFGRVIPMIAPYKDSEGQTGFKTNEDIAADWSAQSTQYGMGKYKKYSYIKFKYRYDKNLKKHIYYLDPERYGTGFSEIMNINLYEARVAFNDW